jgi:uncharacterized membrane protein YfcA
VTVYLLAVAVSVFGGFLGGCIGFGMAMVIVPVMLLVLPGATVVPLMVGISLINSSSILWSIRKEVQFRLVGPLVLGCALGIPLGIELLTYFDGPRLKVGVGVVLIVLATLMLLDWTHPMKNAAPGLFSVGFLSGLMTGSIGIGGPPVVLFLANQDTPRDVFRANLIAYFNTLGWITAGIFAARGAYTLDILQIVAVCIPAVLTGTYIGAKMVTRIPHELFRRLALFLAIASGIVLVVRNLSEM